MKKRFLFPVLIGLLFSCEDEKKISSFDPVNWAERSIEKSNLDSLSKGSSYLSVYSEIYSQTEHRTHGLTATISMRNVNTGDTIYIDKAEYFDTRGKSIRTYFSDPVYIAPLETVEIVVDETDLEGGTGANFIFNWSKKASAREPLFEGVMISTSGQQGLSFTTQGIRIK